MEAYQQARKVLVGSNYMKNLLIQNGLDAGHIAILSYFVQMPGKTKPVAAGTEVPKLLFVGRLEAEKGLAYLLRALAGVSRPYRLLVAGEGSRQEGYKRMAEKLGIAGRVDFLGWVPADRMEQIYEQIACLVFPSIWPEPFGMVGLEAFYHSRPVIAFDVGGVSEWLKDGRNGFLVSPRNTDQLAERIETLLADLDLAAHMGVEGYRHLNEHYRDDNHLERLIDIFKSVLE
jgi:glycosyltransferase involved in cell wall biosynthesis